MNFLNTILNRSNNERPYLILVCGLPERNAQVPKIKKKSFNDSVSFFNVIIIQLNSCVEFKPKFLLFLQLT